MMLGTCLISGLCPPADILGFDPIQQAVMAGIFLILAIGLLVSAAKVGGFNILFSAYRGDVTNFSGGRIWAISSVCFRESIRKHVLWVIPLAIAVVLVVAAVEHPTDDQDAIRQTTKYCLFASGMVVVLTSIILACTSLPKEIESKVIFTIVTKPCTRLEVVLGKIIGFARVSGTILILMGLFALVYLSILAHIKQRAIDYKLHEGGDLSQTERYRLSRYRQVGLLNAATYTAPSGLEMTAGNWNCTLPQRSVLGASQQDIAELFPVDKRVLVPTQDPGQTDGEARFGLVLKVHVKKWLRTGDPDEVSDVYGPQVPTKNFPPPAVSIEVFDENHYTLISGQATIGATDPDSLFKAVARKLAGAVSPTELHSSLFIRLPEESADGCVYAYVPATAALALRGHPCFFVRVVGLTKNVIYTFDRNPVEVFVPVLVGDHDLALTEKPAVKILPLPDKKYGLPFVVSQGAPGVHAEQTLKGGKDATGVAVYHFTGTALNAGPDGNITFEILPTVQRTSSDSEEGREDPTQLNISVYDIASRKLHTLAEPARVESRLTTFFDVPASYITGGDFELLMGCRNNEQNVLLYRQSVHAVASRQSFAFNLAKSLLVMWMMSVMVIVIAVFCSTFVSWPIAFVLAIVLLLSHWAVSQLSDSLGSNLGRSFVTDMRMTDQAAITVVSTGVNVLSNGLASVSRLLPDTARFDAISDIEQGNAMPLSTVGDAALVLALFGIPSILFAYLIFRAKEVAP